jgi:hypothetical protein
MNDGSAQFFSRFKNISALFGFLRFRRDSSLSLIIRKKHSAAEFYQVTSETSPSLWFYGFHTPDKLDHKTTLINPNHFVLVLIEQLSNPPFRIWDHFA